MTRILNPRYYRIDTSVPGVLTAHITHITPANVESLLDKRAIQCAMQGGRWWTIRRNGMTERWVRDSNRIRIPFKAGLRTYGAITERDFIEEEPPTKRIHITVDPKCYECVSVPVLHVKGKSGRTYDL